MMKIAVLVAIVAVASGSICPFRKATLWDGLSVTWNPNPFSQYSFTTTPRTIKDAQSEGFALRDDTCKDVSAKFRGVRYWKNNDPGMSLLFDVNGFIAGIQTSVPKSHMPEPDAPLKNHPYIEDGDHWTLTAYFVDPEIVCTTGRSQSDFDKEGTGDQLFIQNGTNALTDSLAVPSLQEDLDSGKYPTLWTKGYCFWTMGVHYWWDITEDMNCDRFFPFFILYNGGKLTGFGFATNVGTLESPRYEHPGPREARLFINPFPKCVDTDPKQKRLSTMHVWMTAHPRFTAFC